MQKSIRQFVSKKLNAEMKLRHLEFQNKEGKLNSLCKNIGIPVSEVQIELEELDEDTLTTFVDQMVARTQELLPQERRCLPKNSE